MRLLIAELRGVQTLAYQGLVQYRRWRLTPKIRSGSKQGRRYARAVAGCVVARCVDYSLVLVSTSGCKGYRQQPASTRHRRFGILLALLKHSLHQSLMLSSLSHHVIQNNLRSLPWTWMEDRFPATPLTNPST